MCDFFDDFNDFGENGFMNDDTFEDSLEGEMDEPFDSDTDLEDETAQAEPKDNFTAKDAFIIGGAFGFGYEEGLRERKRRKRIRFSDEDDSD